MSKILNEFENEEIKKNEKAFYVKIFFLVLAVIFLGIYVGDVLFGRSSLEVLLDLQDGRDNLKQNIKIIKQQNALLQKGYFELKQLEPN